MEGFKVRCQSCHLVLYETTEFYNCHKPLTGDMLRLLPLYKDWPTYDGSLASRGTPRFSMFCSQCVGYISTTGGLNFADFPDTKITEISKERSRMTWWDSPVEVAKPTWYGSANDVIDNLILPDAENSALTDEPKAEEVAVTPAEMMKKLDKRARISSKKKGK